MIMGVKKRKIKGTNNNFLFNSLILIENIHFYQIETKNQNSLTNLFDSMYFLISVSLSWDIIGLVIVKMSSLLLSFFSMPSYLFIVVFMYELPPVSLSFNVATILK